MKIEIEKVAKKIDPCLQKWTLILFLFSQNFFPHSNFACRLWEMQKVAI